MEKLMKPFIFTLVIFLLSCQNNETPDKLLKTAKRLEGDVLRCTEKISQCKTNYENILIKFPESEAAPVACFKLGRLNELFGHFKDAADYYRKLAQNYPESSLCCEGLYRLARIDNFNLDRHEDAIIIYQRLRDLYPDSARAVDACLDQAEIYLKKSKPLKAIATYQEFVSGRPGHPLREEIYFRIGGIYQFKIKDPDQARKIYEKIMRDSPRSSWAKISDERIKSLQEGEK